MTQKPVVAETLDSMQQLLQEAFGENLVSILHYGPLHNQDLSKVATADAEVKVLIVVESLVDADWGKMSRAFDQLRGRASVVPLLLTEKSLASSTDVFPILIREIKRGSQLLFGVDHVSNLEIQRSHLRLRCEQELRTLQQRMQSICLMHFASPYRLRTAMVSDYKTFEPLLEVAMELSGKLSKKPSEMAVGTIDELITSAASILEMEAEPLVAAMEFANGNGDFDEETFGRHYVDLMIAVRLTANFVDQLPVER